eukprot:CAMPEP_0183335626 /NCGR_PEP_ID=MMETSP0164_2-20130417/3866_1 /TAXON_ID=221442 /ORGANISM="Coccolithus pelagicus ssp braarudi, Strain PLY182g" /LENGTH=192 /DNA_ID=CAMNT_0025505019 /DNA_START=470 /DNA_END=1050 /DNA_ORIENTATION=+
MTPRAGQRAARDTRRPATLQRGAVERARLAASHVHDAPLEDDGGRAALHPSALAKGCAAAAAALTAAAPTVAAAATLAVTAAAAGAAAGAAATAAAIAASAAAIAALPSAAATSEGGWALQGGRGTFRSTTGRSAATGRDVPMGIASRPGDASGTGSEFELERDADEMCRDVASMGDDKQLGSGEEAVAASS